jgi:probable HAF family extracellular repeat protein
MLRTLVLAGFLAAVPLTHAAEYTLTDLGEGAFATAINLSGEVVGSLPTVANSAAVLAPYQLTIPHGTRAYGISPTGALGLGVIVGAGDRGAFLIRPTEVAVFLEPTNPYSQADDINAVETVVGSAMDNPVDPAGALPLVWTYAHRDVLPTLGGRAGYASAINSSGDIVGTSQTASGAWHATLWPLEGAVSDLDAPTGLLSLATGVNEGRRIVGQATFGTQHCAFVHDGQGLHNLGTLPGDTSSLASGINTANVIVGSSARTTTTGGSTVTTRRAVLITGGVMVDLNTRVEAPGWVLETANALNDQGQIVGQGTLNGTPHAWLLTPITPTPLPPVGLVMAVHGDFNGDGREDLAGLSGDMRIWRCLAGDPACVQLPGLAVTLVAGDLDGDGVEDLAVLTSNHLLWVMTDEVQWHQVNGLLATLVSGRFLANGHDQLAGLALDNTIWFSEALNIWEQLPGQLTTLIVGDFSGSGHDELAGIGAYNTLWWTGTLEHWTQLPGLLESLFTVPGMPDGMKGKGLDHLTWYAPTLGAWRPVNH